MDRTLLSVKSLSISYGGKNVAADLSFDLMPGEIMSVAGESGCGKSSLLKALLGLVGEGIRVTNGSIVFDGVSLVGAASRQRNKLKGRSIGLISQNPGASFNPIRRYRKQFAETLKSHGIFRGEESYKDILNCFEKLQLPDGERILKSCPYEMSGGMNQRIAIALTMLLEPKLLLADEPTSALDVTTQMQVIDELMRLREINGTAIIIVTHNLGIAAKMADKLGIMYAGRMVEYGDMPKVLKNPRHPYTRSLIGAVPDLCGEMPRGLDGQPPLFGADMDGCVFSGRCPVAMRNCADKGYKMLRITDGHYACCDKG